jgi:hypothetical protein
MRRRDFIQAIVGSAIASPLTAWAQQSGRIRLIGVLINAPENDPEMQASLIALWCFSAPEFLLAPYD